MAKMDRYESSPQIFKENNMFLLPISRKEYAIIKGNGYHKLETINKKLEIYSTSKPFPESAIGIESESIFLDYANSCGLLEKLCQTNNLILTFRGRRTTPTFHFKVKDSSSNSIKVEHAQIEIDSAFETLDQIIIFEAKIGIPDSFNIRQLYYPFRTFYGKKKIIRNFFFYLIPNEKIYLFWEYVFNPFDEFNSIKLVDSRKFKVKLSNPISVTSYQKINPNDKKIHIPQADDVNKIIEFPLRVFEGYNTSAKMINAFGFVKRQSSYYRQAAELLGLVESDRNKYKLTQGEEFLKLPSEQKSNFVCKLLLEFSIINEIFLQISIDRTKKFTRNDIIKLLKKRSHITGATLKRRTQTIVSWFKWIRNNIGLVEVDYYGNINIAKQLKLN